MKKLILPILIICSSSAYSANENLTPTKAAKTLTNEISRYVTGFNSDNYMYMNNRIVYWNLTEWNDVFLNTFTECDEMAIKFQDVKLQNTCYSNIVESFLKWLEVSIDPSVSNYVWTASGSGAFSSNNPKNTKVNFKVWVENIPKFKKQEAEINYKDNLRLAKYPYEKKIAEIRNEIIKEEQKTFKSKNKIERLKVELSQAKRELNEFITNYSEGVDQAL